MPFPFSRRKPPGTHLSLHVAVHLTHEQYAYLKHQTELTGESLSTIVRWLVAREMERDAKEKARGA